jgi:hypothetical protein
VEPSSGLLSYTLMLVARNLETHQAFQAAVRRETGASFQYLPAGQPWLLDAVQIDDHAASA